MNPASALLLCCAIAAEVCGTLALKSADGFSRVLPTVLVIVCYIASFVLLGFALSRGLPLGIGYALWAASGTAIVAIAGALIYHDRLGVTALIGIGCIVVGAVLVNLGAESVHS